MNKTCFFAGCSFSGFSHLKGQIRNMKPWDKTSLNKMIHKRTVLFFGLTIVGLLSFNLFAGTNPDSTNPPPCTWDNPFNVNSQGDVFTRTETITLRRMGEEQDGTPRYETCAQATARVRSATERSFGRSQYHRPIDGDRSRTCSANYTPPPCTYTPPKTSLDQDPKPRTLTIRRTGQDQDGNPCYESCQDAQLRAQNAFIQTEWGGHADDLKKSIEDYNQSLEDEALSSSKKAEKSAKMQKLGGMAAIGGAMLAAKRAMACCAATNPGPCCPSYWALAAALGVAGGKLFTASSENEGISDQYSALIPTNRGGGGDDSSSSSTDGSTSSTNGTTGTTGTTGNPETNDNTSSGGPGTDGGLPNPTQEIVVDDERLPPTPENFENLVKKGGGGEIDPKTGTITLPNGQKYSPSDLDKPEFQKFMNSPAMADFKKDMAGIEDQVASAMGEEGMLDDTGTDGATDSSNPMAGGGGGFSGYAGGGGLGSAHGASGGGRGLSSANSAGKGKKDGQAVAGMSVKRGKDRIGVSQDNIFYMIHRRYQKKRKKQHFIETPKGG